MNNENKGGKAAKRTLTDLCREARAVRDEARKVLEECYKCVDAVEFVRRRMGRLAWFAGGLSALNVALVLLAVFH